MDEYVVALTFPGQNASFEALAKLRESSGELGVQSAGILERSADGQVRLIDAEDDVTGNAALGGSLIGMLVGVLGGPIGILLGATAGAVTGALFDADRLDAGDDALTKFSRLVAPGTNAVVAETREEDTAILDGFVRERNGNILRRPVEDVLRELEQQQAAAEAAADAARKAAREERHEARQRTRAERIETLRARFSHHS